MPVGKGPIVWSKSSFSLSKCGPRTRTSPQKPFNLWCVELTWASVPNLRGVSTKLQFCCINSITFARQCALQKLAGWWERFWTVKKFDVLFKDLNLELVSSIWTISIAQSIKSTSNSKYNLTTTKISFIKKEIILIVIFMKLWILKKTLVILFEHNKNIKKIID